MIGEVVDNNKPNAAFDYNVELDPNQNQTPNEKHIQKELDKKSYYNMKISEIKYFNLTAKFPVQLEYKQLINKISEDFLKGYEIVDKSGVYSKDKEIVKRQSGLIKEIVTQLAKNFLKGEGAIALSLPIRIFEPRTMLERLTDWFGFAPILLKKAACMADKVEVIKQVICFSISSLFKSTQQLKPLNPMLGETYEASFEDGTKVYLEHTCHNPPISHYYICDDSNLFKCSGYFNMGMDGMLKSLINNQISILFRGRSTVYFPETKQKICFQFPKTTLGGIIYGQRYVLFTGHMKFEDRENGIKAIVKFNKSSRKNPGKRVHDIYGEIFKYDFSKKSDDNFYEKSCPKHPWPKKDKDIFCKITGSWLENIKFDGKEYWNIRDNVSPQLYPAKKCLDSDCRYREDKEWLQLAFDNKDYEKLYQSYSQNWKLALEAQQRYERLLRKEYKIKNNIEEEEPIPKPKKEEKDDDDDDSSSDD